MEFVEGKIEEEKVFGGVVFPKTLNPPKGDGDGVGGELEEWGTDELIEMVREKGEWLCEILKRHSAILFRGFNVCSASDFGRVVQAFGWEEMGYLGATRVKVADRVYTANQAPPDQFINFHHEMAQIKQFPSKIFFFCSQQSPEGGQTSIVPSHIIVEKMVEKVPEFVTKLSEIGYVFRLKTPTKNNFDKINSKTWQSFLQTEDQVEARNRALKTFTCSAVNFNKDGSAEFVYGPMNRIREFGGRKVWFNTISGYTSYENDVNATFGDGTHFPSEALDAYKQVLEENCVDLMWQKGDILLVDNLCAQHARRPGKAPRVILVSICK